jgi:lipoate---protein ligase
VVGPASVVLAENHLHAYESGADRPIVRFVSVTTTAIVLGASQSESLVDTELAKREGVEFLKRRSGGGAVWVAPGEMVWIDVIIPASDPRWVVDVNHAFHWLGQVWRNALIELGFASDSVSVHQGALVHNSWSKSICYAGVGPGEVLLHKGTGGGQKVVGIAQKRTRAGAWFQCGALLHWNPDELVRFLQVGAGLDVHELRNSAIALAASVEAVESAFLRALIAW